MLEEGDERCSDGSDLVRRGVHKVNLVPFNDRVVGLVAHLHLVFWQSTRHFAAVRWPGR